MTYKERIAITVPNPDANEKTIFNDAADGLLKTKDSSGVVETLATTEGIAATEPKVYVALLTQSGTDAPVATVLKNTLGGTIVWTRDSAGIYFGTLVGAFAGNVLFYIPELQVGLGADEGGLNSKVDINKVDDDTIRIYTTNSSGTTDDAIGNSTSLKIEVYP